MKLKLKNNTIIPLDEFFMNAFCAYIHVNDMEEYHELPTAVEDLKTSTTLHKGMLQDTSRSVLQRYHATYQSIYGYIKGVITK